MIRPLDARDAGAFQRLRLQALRECPSAFASSEAEESHLDLGTVAARLAPAAGRVVLGAFAEESMVGQLGLVREHRQKLAHKAFVWGMYVAPEARGRGIATALMKAALTRARAMQGLRQVYLGVNAGNAPALALYRGLGFEAFGREPGCMLVDGELHDELHMMLLL